MKKISYKWKLAGQTYEACRDFRDEAELKQHVERLGGELVEIISAENLPDSFSQGGPVEINDPVKPSKPAPNLMTSLDHHLEGRGQHPEEIRHNFQGWFFLLLGIFLGIVLSFTVMFLIFSNQRGEDWGRIRYVGMGLAVCATLIGAGLGFLSSPKLHGGILFSAACALVGLSLFSFIQGAVWAGLVFVAAAFGFFVFIKRN